ncbi:hypothetical protein R5R35_009872 [Gryllus longicercus]|uniref:Beta-1,4-mannosyltransferase n=1 Tax=Gryllus longicercus TaxID=2509291 RepID=A0AAN9ZDX8_9ORTH
MSKGRVSVVVLGDVGRSPRMQYHSLSLANEGFIVDLIGYSGSELIRELQEHPNVTLRYVPSCPDFQSKFPRLFGYVLKVLWQILSLMTVLFCKRRSDYLLVQNPPAIPTLAVCWIYCVLMRSKYIIDWHNYAYTILALSVGNESILVKFSKWFEGWFGRRANANLCVTKALKMDLEQNHRIIATTLYDRPPDCFHPVPLQTSHNLFKKLSEKYEIFGSSDETKTAFTEIKTDGVISLREDRPGLLVSSTSWTEDEDFNILLSALQLYEEMCQTSACALPPLICVITGKGPLKQYYCELIDNAQWKNVKVVTPWLHPSDYPQLLASADLGVCLHMSSSGLDLPMKVADMFGCGLPVCAHTFKCLNELIQHEKNSYVFSTSDELSSQIQSWFKDFPNNSSQKEICHYFKEELAKYRSLRWHENWKLSTSSLFL